MVIIKLVFKTALVSFLLQILNCCVNVKLARFARNDKQLVKFAAINKLKQQILYTKFNGKTFRAMRYGDTTKPILIFVHGSPGSHMDYEWYIKQPDLRKNYCVITYDRSGYGYSDWGKADTSILNQAINAIQVFKPWIKDKKINILGNSFGAPVAATIASLIPNQTNKLIVCAGALEPGNEKIYKISYPIIKNKWRWLVPNLAVTSSEEKIWHKKALLTIAPFFKKFKNKVLILHGSADNLIYPGNVNYTKSMFINAKLITTIWYTNKGHAILYSDREKVLKHLLYFLKH